MVDSEALVCVTSFCFPSAAASVQCLAWVPSAPGMFITGGNSHTGREYTKSEALINAFPLFETLKEQTKIFTFKPVPKPRLSNVLRRLRAPSGFEPDTFFLHENKNKIEKTLR